MFKHWLNLLLGRSVYRYPMTYDQPCQIDCRVISCKFYQGTGSCNNISPAITLSKLPTHAKRWDGL